MRSALPDGRVIAFDVSTEYPRLGAVRVTIVEDAEWTLTLRVPAWAEGATLRVGDETTPASPGAVQVHRAWRAGDAVELMLPLAPRTTAPDARVDAIRGCIAVERGPEVFALESVDMGADVVDAVVAGTPTELDGVVVLPLRDRVSGVVNDTRLVPYHGWARRGPSTMRVWLPTT